MNTYLQKGRFNYILTLDEHLEAHIIAEYLSNGRYYDEHLASITDLQSNTRVIGNTYRRHSRTTRLREVTDHSFWRDIRKEFVRQIRQFR